MESKIALIYHSADVDGLASGSLLEFVFRNLSNFGNKIKYDLIPYNYGTDVTRNPWLSNKEYTEYYFVDITPPLGWFEVNRERIMKGIIRINIFDHHEPIMLKISELEDGNIISRLNYFFNKEMCGALIFFSTFQDFFLQIHDINLDILMNELKAKEIYEKLVLISSYDTWAFNEWKDRKKILGCIGFTEYLYMYTNDIKEFYNKFFETPFSQIMSAGMLLSEYKLGIADKIIHTGFYSEKERAFIVQGIPSWFTTQKIIDKYTECEKIIYFGFKLENPQIEVKVSCRVCAQDTFDCVEYLNLYCDLNSGGHKNAAGGSMSFASFNKFLNLMKFGNVNY